jgi:3-hydroxyacyl-CoA dehydrogenase/enoyl-CoA hydratase/3-hydroxybutyryl-CoA epimerase
MARASVSRKSCSACIPALGGTARFTHLVNPMQAMPLMLTGKTIDARKAKAIGLVDAVTEERHVRNAVRDAVFGKLKRAKPSALIPIMNFSPVRGILASRMVAEASKAAPREHYPAPYALIALWEKHGGDRAAMLKAEKALFRPADGDADGAEPDPRVLPARADEEARR